MRREGSDLIRRSAGTITDVRAGDALCCHGFGKARSVRRGRSDPIRRSGGTFTDVRAGDVLCCHGFGKARSVRRGRSDPIRRSAGTFTDARAGDALCCLGFGKRALCAEAGATPSAAAPAHSPMRGLRMRFAAMDSGKCVHKPSAPGGARGRFLCQALVISRAIAPKPAAAKCCHGFGKARSVRREGSNLIRRSAGTFTDVRAGDALCCHGFGKAHPKAFHAGRRARALSLPGARHFAGDCPEARRRKGCAPAEFLI